MNHPFLKLPGGLFVLIGLASVLIRLVDYGLAHFGVRVGEALLGSPIHGPTYMVLEVSAGVFLILMGVVLYHLSRISARLRGLARNTGGLQ